MYNAQSSLIVNNSDVTDNYEKLKFVVMSFNLWGKNCNKVNN